MLHKHISRMLIAMALLSNTGSETKSLSASHLNVILIFADDLGPGMLGCYGQQLVKSPPKPGLARS